MEFKDIKWDDRFGRDRCCMCGKFSELFFIYLRTSESLCNGCYSINELIERGKGIREGKRYETIRLVERKEELF